MTTKPCILAQQAARKCLGLVLDTEPNADVNELAAIIDQICFPPPAGRVDLWHHITEAQRAHEAGQKNLCADHLSQALLLVGNYAAENARLQSVAENDRARFASITNDFHKRAEAAEAKVAAMRKALEWVGEQDALPQYVYERCAAAISTPAPADPLRELASKMCDFIEWSLNYTSDAMIQSAGKKLLDKARAAGLLTKEGEME